MSLGNVNNVLNSFPDSSTSPVALTNAIRLDTPRLDFNLTSGTITGAVHIIPVIGSHVAPPSGQQPPYVIAYFIHLENISASASGSSSQINFPIPFQVGCVSFNDINNNPTPLVTLQVSNTNTPITNFVITSGGSFSNRSYSFLLFGT
ncbi:MAG: hypothetical protein QW350_04685 [Candidatus Aenigmatarchaeota archaeon]